MIGVKLPCIYKRGYVKSRLTAVRTSPHRTRLPYPLGADWPPHRSMLPREAFDPTAARGRTRSAPETQLITLRGLPNDTEQIIGSPKI